MNPDGYTTATVTVPAGTYTLDGLTILLGVGEADAQRTLGEAVRQGLAEVIPTEWRVQHPLIVESAD